MRNPELPRLNQWFEFLSEILIPIHRFLNIGYIEKIENFIIFHIKFLTERFFNFEFSAIFEYKTLWFYSYFNIIRNLFFNNLNLNN